MIRVRCGGKATVWRERRDKATVWRERDGGATHKTFKNRLEGIKTDKNGYAATHKTFENGFEETKRTQTARHTEEPALK